MGGYIIKGEFIYNNDVVNIVLQSIDYGSVWKNIRSVSKNIYLLSRKYQESKLIELANPILSLVYIYPNEYWGLEQLVYAGIVSIDFIRLSSSANLSWHKRIISMSTGITIEDIIRSDPNSIDWYEISRNPSIKVSDMLVNDDLPWKYDIASWNSSIRIEDFRDNLDKNWDFSKIVRNNSLSIEDLSTIINLSANHNWLQNENATYEDVLRILNKDSYINSIVMYILLDEDTLQSYINRHPNIRARDIHIQSVTPNIIKNNPQIDWDRLEIDYSKFTIEEMMNIPSTVVINIERILHHPDFTMEDFFKYFDLDTFTLWYLLSKSSWLNFDDVLEYKDVIPWDHKGLSANPNVTVDILEDDDFSWIRWDYYYLSRYAQLNFVYIIRNNDKEWYFNKLSYNKSLILIKG